MIWIAPRDELATQARSCSSRRAQQINDLEPLRTESFQLNYQKAADVQKLLSDPAQRILSKRGSAVVDARTNMLFVQDMPSRLDEVRRLIRQIDVAVRQVLIEARIVEANDTFSQNLGVRLGPAGAGLANRRPFGGQGNGLNVGIERRRRAGEHGAGGGPGAGHAGHQRARPQRELPRRRPERVQRRPVLVHPVQPAAAAGSSTSSSRRSRPTARARSSRARAC